MTDEMKIDTINSMTEPEKNPDAEKPKKEKKTRRFKASATLYIWLTIIGVVLIGIGCGVSVFELSEYKMANYRALPADPNLPQIEMQTTILEATYEKGEQFKLNATDWYISQSYDIQYDNTLKDKVIIEVTAPKDLYNIYLTTHSENAYNLYCEGDGFSIFKFALNMAKEGYIPETLPPSTITLTMNEAQAKNFKLNEEYYKAQEERLSYNEQLNEARNEYNEQLNEARNEYNEQLNNQRTEHEEQLNNMREEYQQQINDLQEEHAQQIQNMQDNHNARIDELQDSFDHQQEELREQYEQRIADLEQQLNEARNTLN